MPGINRFTGQPITGWDEVVQSIMTIFTTPLEMRVERRWFGSRVPMLLGETLNPTSILKLFAAMAEGLDLFEPRFKLIQVEMRNSVDDLRSGKVSFVLHGIFRPNAYLGDFTPDFLMSKRQVEVYTTTNGLSVS